MASEETTEPPNRSPTVFLSYASEDRAAARVVRDALPAYGLEVWYDESELGGGEAWDQKIRRQIRECDYFMPLVSAQTEARSEGYFRREWRLAVERTLDMADDRTYLLPVVIDNTEQATARVPEKFLTVQWLRVPGGKPTAAFEAMCRRVAAGPAVVATPVRRAAAAVAGGGRGVGTLPAHLPFPLEEPGQKIRYYAEIFRWAVHSLALGLQRLPRWLRRLGYVFVVLTLVSRGCSVNDSDTPAPPAAPSRATAEKLQKVASQFHTSMDKADVARLGAAIAREFSDADGAAAPGNAPLLAVPFIAPAGDESAGSFAASTFALVYGRIAVASHGRVGLASEPLITPDFAAALERARSNHSTWVLYGAVAAAGAAKTLTIRIAAVGDGSITWSQSWPLAGADATRIAGDVAANLPDLDEK